MERAVMSTGQAVSRQVARVLLFDASDRLLLFWVRDRTDPMSEAYWYLPGGGIEAGESPLVAARRELLEEAGIEVADLGPIVLRRKRVRFRFEGQDYEQDEWLMIGRWPDGRIGSGHPDDVEAVAVAAHRWWSVDDLSRSQESVYPRDLPSIAERLLREGPPSVPWEIEG
jgi:8-oxo-dGTP pyrophosphatase MutT (NUDIX family)